jgi:hypothetical protein
MEAAAFPAADLMATSATQRIATRERGEPSIRWLLIDGRRISHGGFDPGRR